MVLWAALRKGNLCRIEVYCNSIAAYKVPFQTLIYAPLVIAPLGAIV